MKVKVRKDRKQIVAFYVSEAEKSAIVQMARKHDMTISDYCRKVLMQNCQRGAMQ